MDGVINTAIKIYSFNYQGNAYMAISIYSWPVQIFKFHSVPFEKTTGTWPMCINLMMLYAHFLILGFLHWFLCNLIIDSKYNAKNDQIQDFIVKSVDLGCDILVK